MLYHLSYVSESSVSRPSERFTIYALSGLSSRPKDACSSTPFRACHRARRARKKMERETGFEPATPSLEGWCSSQLSYSRVLL